MVKDTAPAEADQPTAEPQVTYASGRVEHQGQADSPPDLRLIHYNDVYHLECRACGWSAKIHLRVPRIPGGGPVQGSA
jgi:hypothetical protein